MSSNYILCSRCSNLILIEMTTSIVVNSPSDDEKQSQIEHRYLLRPPLPNVTPTTTFKPFPQSIIKSIETNRRRHLPHAHSTSDFLNTNQSSIDTIDDDLDDHYETLTSTTTASSRKRSLNVSHTRRSPPESRLTLCPDTSHQHEITPLTYGNEVRGSAPSLIDIKSAKQSRTEYSQRNILERHFARRIHSTFSSSTTLRSLGRRRPQQNLTQRSNRGHPQYLSPNSKWHFVRNHLSDIAMMSESYARIRIIERDLRWMHLRELIRKHVLDMREMSILRQQYDGTLKSTQKTNLKLKAIATNEVVHVERDGRVYSIGIRDLVLGRLIGDDDIHLDTFAQLDARRKFQTKQNLLKQQEGRARLKKHIAFSFCLCNLSFIAVMFAAMFIFAMKTIIELRSRKSV